jgi:hypothetical protein
MSPASMSSSVQRILSASGGSGGGRSSRRSRLLLAFSWYLRCSLASSDERSTGSKKRPTSSASAGFL